MLSKHITTIVLDDETLLSFEEFKEAIYAEEDFINEMIEYELILPRGTTPQNWQFNSECLRRAKIAVRFHRDLEVNVPGISVLLDLLEEIDTLKKRLDLYEK